MKGKVKWFNSEKGFGFIVNEDKQDIFVHYSQIMKNGYKTLEEGQDVEFDLIKSSKGLQAQKVQLIG